MRKTNIIIIFYFFIISICAQDRILSFLMGRDRAKYFIIISAVICMLIVILYDFHEKGNRACKKRLLDDIERIVTRFEYIQLIKALHVPLCSEMSFDKFKENIWKVVLEKKIGKKDEIRSLLDTDKFEFLNETIEHQKEETEEKYSKNIDKRLMRILDEYTLEMDFISVAYKMQMKWYAKFLVFVILEVIFFILAMRYQKGNTVIVFSILTIIVFYVFMTKSKSGFDNNWDFVFMILADMFSTGIITINNSEISENMMGVFLLSLKIMVCILLSLLILNRMSDAGVVFNNTEDENSIVNRVSEAYMHKLYFKYKTFILWGSLIIIICFNIFEFGAIMWRNGYRDIERCFYDSALNYFSGNVSLDIYENSIISVALLLQSIIAFFTNTIFIVKIVENIFNTKNNWEI